MARDKEEIEIDTRLGRRRIDTDKVIRFPHGLAGFEGERDFILLQIRPEAPLLILQSVTEPQVGLLVADPYSFLQSYPVMVGDAEQQLLQIKRMEDAAILVTVSIPAGEPEKAALNLTGPIVINHNARIGLQVPQSSEGPAQINMQSRGSIAQTPRRPRAAVAVGKSLSRADADGRANTRLFRWAETGRNFSANSHPNAAFFSTRHNSGPPPYGSGPVLADKAMHPFQT